jgi:hypothetical protein
MGVEGIIAVVALLVGIVALARAASGQTREGAHGNHASSGSGATDSDWQRVGEQVAQLQSEVAVLDKRVAEQDGLLGALVTEDEARHLWFLERGSSASYDSHPGLQQELRSLTRRGLIQKRGDFKIHELPSPFDLVESFELTDIGRSLLSRRGHLEKSDVEPSDSLPPHA